MLNANRMCIHETSLTLIMYGPQLCLRCSEKEYDDFSFEHIQTLLLYC